jgi:hypothetical protein
MLVVDGSGAQYKKIVSDREKVLVGVANAKQRDTRAEFAAIVLRTNLVLFS